MDYVNLGTTGLKVSRLCLGCMTYGAPEKGSHAWALHEEQSRPFIQKALELGITFFDTANAYSGGASEEVLGRALRDFAQRDAVVVASKVYLPMRPASGGVKIVEIGRFENRCRNEAKRQGGAEDFQVSRRSFMRKLVPSIRTTSAW